MSSNQYCITTDVSSAVSLTVDAITGITDITESLHQTITSVAGLLLDPYQSRTKGITGMVYRNIRNVAQLSGKGINALIEKAAPVVQKYDDSSDREISLGREAFVSALNGIIGDHLVKRDNPLAIKMQLRSNGKPLNIDQLAQGIEQSSGKVAIMVHGLCMSDLQWKRQGHDHGEALARDLGYFPVYLNYNTGLHISENGREFAYLLENFITDSIQTLDLPEPLKLVIIAHSMGGLVSKSGCYYGREAGHEWLNHLDKIVFLGTPHHGAPLAKAGVWVDNILQINPYSAPFAKLGRIRSSGLTDLRYGNVVDEDWKDQDRFALSKDNRTPVPLPEGVDCYSIAVTTFKEPYNCCADLAGDGLVTLSSALGVHKKDKFNLLFPKQNKWVGSSMNHMDIINNSEVYGTIKMWLTKDSDKIADV